MGKTEREQIQPDDIVIPDSVVPITAYRGFMVAGDRLYSFNGTEWPTARLEATCGAGHSHVAPTWGCSCGIYCKNTPQAAIDFGGYVFATIALWGRVIIGTKGYKAQFARPMTIVAPDRAIAKTLASTYEVEAIASKDVAAKFLKVCKEA